MASLSLAGGLVLVAPAALAQEASAATSPPSVVAPGPSKPPEDALPAPSSGAGGGLGPIGGRLVTYVRAPMLDPGNGQIQQASASIWLEAKPRFGEMSSATASVSFDALDSTVEPGPLRARVREAYVAAWKDGWEARVGQQIVSWGNADIVNPTDFLSARDYGFFAVDSEAQRLGNIDVWASWIPRHGDSPFEFVVVWAPILTGSQLLVPPSLIPTGVMMASTESPSYTLAHSEFAAKASYRGEGWDIALSGFTGYNHDPELVLQSLTSQSVTVAPTYSRILAGGLEASATSGKWIVRGDAAFDVTENTLSSDRSIQPSHLDALLGVERPFGDHVRANLQGFLRAYPSFDVAPPATTDAVTAVARQTLLADNQLLQNFQHALLPGATLRIAWTPPGGAFEAEVAGVVNFASAFDRWSCVARPLLTYHATDALRFNLGGEYFGGARDTPLGLLRDFSGVFLGGEYRF